ncbi:hypothetical protein [Streptacidiphilus sp. MAP5-3]|uniref:hypothetical protein n=1 Tax=unclassified Streptacidiphilus TaxID=2643834 RepID=UPI003512AA44
MARTMYDAVTVANLPAGAPLYAGYVDGNYANVTEMRAKYPHATIVEIAVFASTNAGHVLDVETGDATPTEAPGWVLRRRAAGVDPSVYCNTSTWPAVRAAFQAVRVPEPHYWVAQYDGDLTIPTGAVAKQFADPGPYDISSVADYWPGIDPQETDMPLTAADAALVAETLLQTKLASPFRKGPDGKPAQISVAAYLEWQDEHYDQTQHAIAEVDAQSKTNGSGLSALKQQVDALAKTVAAVSAPTLTDAQVAALAAQVAPVLVPQLVDALGAALEAAKAAPAASVSAPVAVTPLATA